jgi:tRNA-intron endonuclease
MKKNLFIHELELIMSEEPSDPLTSLLTTGEFPPAPIEAQIIGNKIVVFRPVCGSLLYGYNRYFGSPLGIRKPKSHIFDRPLELTLFEALYLMKHTKISVSHEKEKNPLKIEEFIAWASQKYPEFADKYEIYEDLREKKYIPRPGQKFGADFIVYKQGPGLDHSAFCIEVLPRNHRISAMDVVRAGRLATSVKKKYVLANALTKTYFQFKWFKF